MLCPYRQQGNIRLNTAFWANGRAAFDEDMEVAAIIFL